MNPRRNYAVWLGPVLAVFGLLSYYTIFAQWPLTRDVPWVNLGILALAVVLSVRGLVRTRTGLGRVFGSAGLLVSVGLTGLLSFYCFSLSYGLPDAGNAIDVGARVASLSLQDETGASVSFGEGTAGRTVVVFYRGHW